jgi:glutamine synthetase
VAGAQLPAVQRLQFFLSESRWDPERVNPYLAVAALIAAGLHGTGHGLELEPILEGNAYVSAKPKVPATLTEAAALFGGSEAGLKAFGEDVVAHYVRAAEVELEAFQKAVTDWERFRGFERL